MRIVLDEAVHSTWKTNYATFQNAPAAVMTIPDIGDMVPLVFTETCESIYREFGKRLLEIGYLEDEADKTLTTIIQEGWSRYVAEISDKTFSRLHFYVSVGQDHSYDYGDDLGDEQLGLYFWCDMTEAPSLTVKDRLEKLRRRNPPLAWMVLSVLEKASMFLPIMTPGWFFALVSQTQWMGEADENGIVSEYLADGFEMEDIHVLTRKDVFKVLPPWAYRACYTKSETVRHKIDRWPLDKKDALLLSKLDDLQGLLHELETERDYIDRHKSISGTTFASLLFFDDGDVGGLFYRVLDDFYRQESEGDSPSYLVRLAFDPADPRQTEQALRVMRWIFRVAEILEEVLTFIGDIL